MRITVSEAAMLLGTSNDTIYRWIEAGDLPAYRINDQFGIHRTELLEWATLRNLPLGPQLFQETEGEASVPTVSEALTNGRVVKHVPGTTRAEVFRSIVGQLDLPLDERAMLLDLLIARDKTALVSLPDGIAIPHVRHPIVLTDRPMLYTFFLSEAIEFLGQRDRVIFLLLAPTIRVHLQIIAKLSFLLRDRDFRDALLRGDMQLAEVARTIEARLA